jgi:hypothetical protein
MAITYILQKRMIKNNNPTLIISLFKVLLRSFRRPLGKRNPCRGGEGEWCGWILNDDVSFRYCELFMYPISVLVPNVKGSPLPFLQLEPFWLKWHSFL